MITIIHAGHVNVQDEENKYAPERRFFVRFTDEDGKTTERPLTCAGAFFDLAAGLATDEWSALRLAMNYAHTAEGGTVYNIGGNWGSAHRHSPKDDDMIAPIMSRSEYEKLDPFSQGVELLRIRKEYDRNSKFLAVMFYGESHYWSLVVERIRLLRLPKEKAAEVRSGKLKPADALKWLLRQEQG